MNYIILIQYQRDIGSEPKRTLFNFTNEDLRNGYLENALRQFKTNEHMKIIEEDLNGFTFEHLDTVTTHCKMNLTDEELERFKKEHNIN